MLKLVRVVGRSMQPVLNDGDLSLAVAWPAGAYRAGQLVLVRVDGELIVKRLARFDDSGRIVLSSDNASTSSVYCGVPLDAARLQGRVFPMPSVARRPAA